MSYRDRIEFIIPSPYTLTEEEDLTIISGRLQGKDWSDPFYTELKGAIRQYLRPLQRGRCAFCRLRIPVSQFYPHLEHIVPKGARPDFTWLPMNLVWCCQRCNFGKGQNITLRIPNAANYPNETDEFLVLNPYKDYFFHNFDLIEDLIIIPINDSLKASNTFKFYKLDRLEIAEDRAFELKTIFLNLTKEEIASKLTIRLTKENDPRILQLIEYYLAKIPDWIID